MTPQRSSEQSLLQTENKNNDKGEISSIVYFISLMCKSIVILFLQVSNYNKIKKEKLKDNIPAAYLCNGFQVSNMWYGQFYNIYKQEILVHRLIYVGYLN